MKMTKEVESQSDIDEFYWKTLGDIVYREYWKEHYKKRTL